MFEVKLIAPCLNFMWTKGETKEEQYDSLKGANRVGSAKWRRGILLPLFFTRLNRVGGEGNLSPSTRFNPIRGEGISSHPT